MRAVVRGLLPIAILLAAARANAADVQTCLDAAERGQRARSSGKLREARDSFQLCGLESCPAMVRRDCVQWLSEVTQSLPTLVFGAKDANGRDLFDVTVSMDGEVILGKLDGKSVAVDPGPHTFKFDVPGRASVVERALVKEGEKSRVMSVSFGADPNAPPPSNGDKPQPPPSKGGHGVLPWIVVGLGGAAIATGVVVFLTAPELPSNCDPSRGVCTKRPDQTSADLARDQDQAGKHDAQESGGLILAGVGGAVLVGGLLWHFLEPTGASSGMSVTPWTSASSAGLTLGGRF